mmetsp:Transcript_18491/g.56800  ORF Transcript_18491/g.56800 Transcript_18491/m.56800 type:complete len:104 (-) Transcript_18491:595-906(-)
MGVDNDAQASLKSATKKLNAPTSPLQLCGHEGAAPANRGADLTGSAAAAAADVDSGCRCLCRCLTASGRQQSVVSPLSTPPASSASLSSAQSHFSEVPVINVF